MLQALNQGYSAANVSSVLHSSRQLLRLMGSVARFLEGAGEDADKRRHGLFKLIPSVVQASWIIKQAVGQKPVLLGQKLTTKYSR